MPTSPILFTPQLCPNYSLPSASGLKCGFSWGHSVGLEGAQLSLDGNQTAIKSGEDPVMTPTLLTPCGSSCHVVSGQRNLPGATPPWLKGVPPAGCLRSPARCPSSWDGSPQGPRTEPAGSGAGRGGADNCRLVDASTALSPACGCRPVSLESLVTFVTWHFSP